METKVIFLIPMCFLCEYENSWASKLTSLRVVSYLIMLQIREFTLFVLPLVFHVKNLHLQSKHIRYIFVSLHKHHIIKEAPPSSFFCSSFSPCPHSPILPNFEMNLQSPKLLPNSFDFISCTSFSFIRASFLAGQFARQMKC